MKETKHSRVTEKYVVVHHEGKYRPIEKSFHVQDYIYTKLGIIEDIEDDLGVDIIMLFRALKDGIYILDDYGAPVLNDAVELTYNPKNGEWSFGYCWKFSDYGKTWAFTKEELIG